MNKKIILALFILLAFTYAPALELAGYRFSPQQEAGVDAYLSESYAASQQYWPESVGASSHAVVDLDLSIRYFLTCVPKNQNKNLQEHDEDFITTRTCPAVVVDRNWLIASASCLDAGNPPATWTDKDGNKYDCSLRTRRVDHAQLNGRIISPYNAGELLAFDMGKALALWKAYEFAPKANIYIPQNNTVSAYHKAQFIINMSSEEKRAVKKTTFNRINKDKSLNLKSGKASQADPLFVVADRPGESRFAEFIVAFNSGPDTKNSNAYKELSSAAYKSLYNAINTIDPGAWSRIDKKIVRDMSPYLKR